MDEDQVRTDERIRIADALTRYLVEGTGTFRVLIDYIGVDYEDGMREGWLGMNNALSDHEDKVRSGERNRLA